MAIISYVFAGFWGVMAIFVAFTEGGRESADILAVALLWLIFGNQESRK